VIFCGFRKRCPTVISKTPFTSDERRAVLALASLYSFRMLGLFMVLPLLGVYAAGMPGATPAMLGLALGAYGLTQAALQLPLGWLSDRVGRRPIILLGLSAFIAGSLVAAYAETLNGIIVGRFLQGCGAIAAALTAMAADYTRDSQRTKTMAIIGASVGLSFVIALVLGPLLAAVGGLGLVFMTTAGMGVIGFLLVALVLPKVPAVTTSTSGATWQANHIFGGGLPVLYAGIFLLHGIIMATFLVVPDRLANTVGFPADHHWAVYLGAVIISVPPALLLMRRGRGGDDPRRVLLISVTALLVGSLAALNVADLYGIGIGLVSFFVGINTLEAVLPALVTRIAPDRSRGAAMGVFSSCQFLGIFVGGSAGGFVLGSGGLVAISGLVAGLTMIWVLLLAFVPMVIADTAETESSQ